MIVYLVKQTQDSEGYDNRTIYVCSTKERAIEYTRKLNKQYGYGVEFDDNYDFFDFIEESDNRHYYTVESMVVDRELAPFYT